MAAATDTSRVTTAIPSTVGGGADVFNLPASIAAGDLLLLMFDIGNMGSPTITGWTRLVTSPGTTLGGSASNAAEIYYKFATGSEGSTQAYTAGFSGVKESLVCWRITGNHASTPPEVSTTAQSSGSGDASPNPTAVTPSGGSNDYLYIWMGATNGQPTMPPTGNPTGYSNPVGVLSGGSGGASGKNCAFGASKQTTGSTTEDPSVWTLSGANNWGAWVVAVYPAAGGGGVHGSAMQVRRQRRASRFATLR